jgi:CRP/FNR family cyclic AMP-dependent transcriptional regulator
LADMIGTTRSCVSFFMNKFRKLGLVSYNGGIEVHNSLLNAVLHDRPQIQRN